MCIIFYVCYLFCVNFNIAVRNVMNHLKSFPSSVGMGTQTLYMGTLTLYEFLGYYFSPGYNSTIFVGRCFPPEYGGVV